MGNLTNDQAIQVSDILHQLSDAISNYVVSNEDNLAPEDKQSLVDTQGQILNLADGVLDNASDLIFQDVGTQMTQLTAINTNIAAKLKTLASIQNVIEVAADVLTMTSAICTFNPGQIAQSAGDIINKLGIKIG
jgi:hypothetical protein